MEAMESSPQDPPGAGRLAKALGFTALLISGVVIATFATSRWRKMRQTEDLIKALPPPQQPSDESTVEPAEPVEVQDTELQEDTTPEDIEEAPQKQPLEELTVEELEELTVEELYRLARRYDIPGRSSMRKAELIEALETEGIVEAEV